MSKLDELIAELCPDGVEYMKLRRMSVTIEDDKKHIQMKNCKVGNIWYVSGTIYTNAGYFAWIIH